MPTLHPQRAHQRRFRTQPRSTRTKDSDEETDELAPAAVETDKAADSPLIRKLYEATGDQLITDRKMLVLMLGSGGRDTLATQ